MPGRAAEHQRLKQALGSEEQARDGTVCKAQCHALSAQHNGRSSHALWPELSLLNDGRRRESPVPGSLRVSIKLRTLPSIPATLIALPLTAWIASQETRLRRRQVRVTASQTQSSQFCFWFVFSSDPFSVMCTRGTRPGDAAHDGSLRSAMRSAGRQ